VKIRQHFWILEFQTVVQQHNCRRGGNLCRI